MGNIIDDVRERIKALELKKADTTDAAKKELEKAEKELEKAESMKAAAVKEMDAAGYKKADSKIADLTIEKRMYADRLQQLLNQELISEAESDNVIDSLIEYQDAAEKEFEAAAGPVIDSLIELYSDCADKITAAEDLINEWTYKIHANHRAQIGAYPKGKEPRRAYSVPVHTTGRPAGHVFATVRDFVNHI